MVNVEWVVARHSLFVFVCTCIFLDQKDVTLSSLLLLGYRHGDMACGCSPGQLTPVWPPRPPDCLLKPPGASSSLVFYVPVGGVTLKAAVYFKIL